MIYATAVLVLIQPLCYNRFRKNHFGYLSTLYRCVRNGAAMEKYFNWSDVEKFRKNVLDSKIRTEFEKCAAKGKDVYDEKLADTFERIKSECKDKKDKVDEHSGVSGTRTRKNQHRTVYMLNSSELFSVKFFFKCNTHYSFLSILSKTIE